MAHARKQIRDAVVTAVTGLGLTASRVYPSRVLPLEAGSGASLLVYTGAETVEADNMGHPVVLLRTLEVSIEGRTEDAAGAALENTLDAIAAQVEAALGTAAGGKPLSGLVLDMQLTGVEPELDGSAETVKGSIRLDYAVQYRTLETDAETILDQ